MWNSIPILTLVLICYNIQHSGMCTWNQTWACIGSEVLEFEINVKIKTAWFKNEKNWVQTHTQKTSNFFLRIKTMTKGSLWKEKSHNIDDYIYDKAWGNGALPSINTCFKNFNDTHQVHDEYIMGKGRKKCNAFQKMECPPEWCLLPTFSKCPTSIIRFWKNTLGKVPSNYTKNN